MAGNTSLEPMRFSRSRARALLRLLCICSIMVLSACGMQNPFASSSGQQPPVQKNAPPPPQNAGMSDTTSHMEPLKLEPTPRVNYKNMFGKSLRSDEERLDRLERAVQNLRNEFDKSAPSIKRLMAIERDIQDLLVELRKMADESDAMMVSSSMASEATVPQAPPAQKKARAKPKVKAPPPVTGGKASVYDVRTGEHPGKTRIVLDVNSKTGFSTDIDNDEKIMIVELPNASWDTATSRNLRNSPYISSYKAEETGEGSMLIFQLKRNVKIAYQGDLKSLSASAGRRIVIDLTDG